jgi:lysophospholipase L1-like esterase
MRQLQTSFFPFVVCLAAIACSSNTPAPQGGTGGQGSGGVVSSGGKIGSGSGGAGGTAGSAAGGVSGAGGNPASGGSPATGGSSAASGGTGRGGGSGTGGTAGIGGNSSGQGGGNTGVGGTSAKGGTTSMAGGAGGTSSGGDGGAGATGSGGTMPASGGRSGADAGTSSDGPGGGGRNSGGSAGQAGGAGGQSTPDASPSTGGSGGGTGYNPCKASPCVILPLGDSITHGWGSTDDAGYRSALFKLIVAANQNVTFIGSLTNPNTALTVLNKPFPAHHEGHDGITVSDITGWVPPAKAFTATPHIVLLHIGTNDVTGSADPSTTANQLDTLVADLVKAAPDALILVAKIIPLFYASTTYNNYVAKIQGIVSAHAAMNEHVVMVDMTSFPSTDYGNGVHPSDQGYVYMGNLWYQAIKGYLP